MILKRPNDEQEAPKKVLITDYFGQKHVSKAESKQDDEETVIKVVTESIAVLKTTSKSPEVDDEYELLCKQNNFNKEEWVASLSEKQRELLELEIKHLHISWLVFLHQELTKPYFLKLKEYLQKEFTNKTIFPPQDLIYSWSHYTPLPSIKCLVLGQDPYHNHNQAHGLAFSVLEPTRPPPSLINIYKTIAIDYPSFITPDFKTLNKKGGPGGGGNLSQWAQRGVLMLNACLTVEAHKANSHKGQGWEKFTEEVIRVALNYHLKDDTKPGGFVIMAWGSPAQARIKSFSKLLQDHSNKFLVLKTVHPSPLSARLGFFDSNVFKKCNNWLEEKKRDKIDWGLEKGNVVT